MGTTPPGVDLPQGGFNWWGFLALGLIVAVASGAGYWVWQSVAAGDGGSLARADEIEAGSVRYYSDERLYLVRTPAGELLAFGDRDTSPGAMGRECAVAWRPDLTYAGVPGAFSGRCSGSVWSIEGRLIEGQSARGLDRYDVVVDEEGNVEVDRGTRHCGPPRDGEGESDAEDCVSATRLAAAGGVHSVQV